MTLMRFDPLREWDRFTEQAFRGTRAMQMMPMEAYRRGDEFHVALDLPGVNPDDIDVTAERNVINIRATRRPAHSEDDEVLVDERPHGEFSRQLFLGDNLDPSNLTANCESGVLTLRIPVAESSKPRKIQVGAEVPNQQSVEAQQSQREKARA
ncbi:Hsp20/alpha crystallin family protein [Saccharopolyspora rhizosphaerae]|uniref:Hsp20/alpha crystallin family protein n=1 Tax=Saccharopolyspora rhizosphaerae TaxID=2492662 RepID=A0A426JNL9_9PSEU|nr:Hsp20/alpha crystallin family protein [Saccharopolyspora rhizosphaerae]RRO14685.1 Hsp20/alpha crystallin family protein [Saccharopolyspora rhizosphaerae]